MITRAAVAITLMAGLATVHAQPAALTDAEIQQAVAHAASVKTERDLLICPHGPFGVNFTVCIVGPEARVGLEAFHAKREYRAFDVASLTPETVAKTWTVIARPDMPELGLDRMIVPIPATNIVLQPSGHKDAPAVHALSSTVDPVSWSNAVGGAFQSAGVTAIFDPASIPAGALDVVVVTDRIEYRYLLTAKERAKIR